VAVSHPFALAQCQKFIARHSLSTTVADSTSAACQSLAQAPDNNVLALGSPLAGDIYGLHVFEKNVEDNKLAHTKFYLLSNSLPRQRRDVD
jgi:prephenate dehydratase